MFHASFKTRDKRASGPSSGGSSFFVLGNFVFNFLALPCVAKLLRVEERRTGNPWFFNAGKLLLLLFLAGDAAGDMPEQVAAERVLILRVLILLLRQSVGPVRQSGAWDMRWDTAARRPRPRAGLAVLLAGLALLRLLQLLGEWLLQLLDESDMSAVKPEEEAELLL